MNRYTLLFTIFFISLSLKNAIGQILKPASWSYDISKKEVRIGEELELIFKVQIAPDWYLYSSDFDPDLGPMVTAFEFIPHPSYQRIGGIKPIGAKKKYDDTWEGEYTYFVGTAEFRQKIKILAPSPVIRGSYDYQVCTDVDGKCIPFDDTFSFTNLTVLQAPANGDINLPAEEKSIPKPADVGQGDTSFSDLDIIDSVKAEVQTVEQDQIGRRAPDLPTEEELLLLNGPSSPEGNDPYSLAAFMLVAFLAGLAALLTPCVFPMIPMTVTFFTGNSKNRGKAIAKALIYGFSIILIYTLAGTLVAWINGPEFANWLSTHWAPNLFFFAIFVIFGLSFLGLFDITLPSSLVNSVDEQADKGGYYGVFFMAFTLVLVSFSCTGPIVGSILVESAGGEIVKPIAGMFAFSLAFAIPFTLFAIFPEWLNSLPKSGGWLNAVKVVLGFLELALALKFLSIADQVYHWGILDRHVFIAIWIAILFFLGLYLLGKIRLPHDSETKAVSVPRLMLALLTFSFIIYLIPGLFGAPLKALAGYLPPMSTHDFDISSLLRDRTVGPIAEAEELCAPPKYGDMLEFPHGIQGYFDYDQALACAKAKNKPIFIDFTGHGCVNCREMEANVWSEPEVLERLKNDYIMLALYVDEKKELPEEDWYTSNYDGKVKKTLGKQNADLQITRFKNNAQPFYVILSPEGKLLSLPIAYERDVNKFIEFLDNGLERAKEIQ